MNPLAIVKTFSMDDEFNRDDVLLVHSAHTSGVSSFGGIGALSHKYPYFRLLQERVKSYKGNWATPETRGQLGTCQVFTPSSSQSGPTIASLLCHYSEFNTPGQEFLKSNHPDQEHQKNVLNDGEESRLTNFYLSLAHLNSFIPSTGSATYSPLDNVRTIVIPYLIGCNNIKLWNSEYLPQIIHFAKDVHRRSGVRTVLSMTRYLNFIMKENPELDTVCQFSNSLRNIKQFDSFNSYETAHLWMSDEQQVRKLERENILRKLKTIKHQVQNKRSGDDEHKLVIDCPSKKCQPDLIV